MIPARAAAAAAPARRARRPPRRRRPGHRGELRLARDGDLEGPRDRVGEAPPRPRRPRRRHDRRRRAAGGPELRGRCRPRRTSGSPGSRSSSTATSCSRTSRPTRSSRSASSRSASARSAGTSRRCDGHDLAALRAAFAALRGARGSPAGARRRDDQGQGRVVHGASRRAARGRRHVPLARGRARRRVVRAGVRRARRADRRAARGARPRAARASSRSSRTSERSADARGRARVGSGRARARRSRTSTSSTRTARSSFGSAPSASELVVLDADLASDCRVRAFELAYPDRFVECGIAEQDMVSTAAGLARHGLLPVVNSFASFLASRANEQIYNQASERHEGRLRAPLRGAHPGRPGQVAPVAPRHLAARGASRSLTIVQPGNAEETRALLRWAVERAEESVAIRLAIGPSPRRIELAGELEVGRGRLLREGADARPARLRARDAARGAHSRPSSSRSEGSASRS